ncbi:MAG: PIG-L family deacetylase, partial [Acidimicrobiales bacterium]
MSLLTVHAHPDDEAIQGAGTVHRYTTEGMRTTLVCCTGGEQGEIQRPEMDRPEVHSNLAAVRREELRRSAEIIGYSDVRMLGYEDSGMAGTATTLNPRCFVKADLDEAVDRLVRIIQEVRPQVMVTYTHDERVYPHPDHLKAHVVASEAFRVAGQRGERPYQPQRLFLLAWTRAPFVAAHKRFEELGLDSGISEAWLRFDGDDAEMTTHVAVDATIRRRGLWEHRTQYPPEQVFWRDLPEAEQALVYPYDDYIMAADTAGNPAP